RVGHLGACRMAEMRLVIAGAGGRMGRTLIKAAATTEGAKVVGALEGPNSPVLGEDAGVLAGLPASGVKVTSDAKPLLAAADAVVDFTVPAATVALAKLTAAAGCAHVIGTTG